MKVAKLIGLAALSAFMSFAWAESASAVTLTFEGLGDNAPIGSYYDGGAGGNFGIVFGADSLALIEGSAGGSGNFSNAPSGHTIAYFLGGPGDLMDVAGGFTTGFSFFYADQVGFTGQVDVFDGLGGTGTLLASLLLPSTPDPYNVWVPIGVAFLGTAHSVLFSGAANFIGFDNITLGSVTPGTPGAVPLPPALPLFASAITGLGLLRWRRGRKATA